MHLYQENWKKLEYSIVQLSKTVKSYRIALVLKKVKNCSIKITRVSYLVFLEEQADISRIL